MEYTTEVLSDDKIIRIKIKGRLNFQNADKYSREALKLAREKYINNFILDHSETNKEKGISKLHASEEVLEQFGFKNTDKVAVLISDLDDETDLMKSESKNSNWCTVKYFYASNYNDAVEWLLKTE